MTREGLLARGGAALLLATAPLLAGAWLLAGLVPPPAPAAPTSDRVLWIGAGAGDAAGVRAVATRHPGEAALPAAALGAPLALDTLPFDELRFEEGAASDAAGMPAAGRQDSATPTADGARTDAFAWTAPGVARRARAGWTALDGWQAWQPSAGRGSRAVPCDRRDGNGAWRCGSGVEVGPAVLPLEGAWRGVVRVAAAPVGGWLELPLPGAPPRLRGRVWRLDAAASRPVALELRRGDTAARTTCPGSCSLELPEGEGPLVLRIDGPSPAAAVLLQEAP